MIVLFRSFEQEGMISHTLAVAYKILKTLEMDVDRYMAGDYEIREILYRGSDGRLYN